MFRGVKEETEGKEEIPFAAAANNPRMAKIFNYGDKCFIQKVDDETIKWTWDNGAAVTATRGASTDYIPQAFYMHVNKDATAYDPAADYTTMIAAKVQPRLAWIVCLMRKIIYSLPEIKVTAAECVYGADPADQAKLGADVVKMMADQGQAVLGILQQTFTIFTLNGVSLMQKGHHWVDSDNMWKRFESSIAMDTLTEPLGLVDYQLVIYHHAMHPFDYDWVASLVVDPNSALRKGINGVAQKRLGVLPSGTTSLGLFEPLLAEVAVRDKDLSDMIATLTPAVIALIKKIRATPLDYCLSLPRANTLENIAEVKKIEPIIAFMHGYLSSVESKKSTAMKARLLRNLVGQHSAENALGESTALARPVKARDATTILGDLKALLTAVAFNP